jgi:hypothetical protein
VKIGIKFLDAKRRPNQKAQRKNPRTPKIKP